LVALLLYLYPIFVALLAGLLLREPLASAKKLALGLALTGTALAVGPVGGQAPGILLAAGSALLYAIYILVGTDVSRRVSPVQSSAVIFAAAGIGNGILMMAAGPHLPATGRGWAAIAGLVVITTLLPVMAFLAGLKRIGPTNAAMLSTLEPVVTVLLAGWWLHERLTPLTLLGGGLILTAVLLTIHGEVRRSPSPAAGDRVVGSSQIGAAHRTASTQPPPTATEPGGD
jgi:drug/metabolite transporter (DMT)-like permease